MLEKKVLFILLFYAFERTIKSSAQDTKINCPREIK